VKPIVVTLIVTAVIANHGLVAQSLGELARREAERRKRIETPSKIITDKDLEPAESSPTSAQVAPAAPSAPPPDAAGVMNTPPEPKYVARDPSYWLNRMRELRTRGDFLKLQAAALEKRADELQTDFETFRNPRHRGVSELERQRLRTERALVLADLAATHKQVVDLEEEARRSNVPPGWLRP